MIDSFDPRTWVEDPSARVSLEGITGDIYATVDAEYLSILRKFNSWCVKPGRNTLYARCYMLIGCHRLPFYMHRVILMAAGREPPSPRHTQGDHIDGDGLNNRIANLRWVTHGDNAKNVASYRQNLDIFREIMNA